jgi:perosamine synthetase
MSNKISFAGPWITQKEVDYVMEAVTKGWYENYVYHTRKLEATVCKYLGRKYAVATHCCTQALHLACLSIGLKPGDEVIVTDHSWVATAHTIAYTGATCVFADIEEGTLCIDPKAIRKAITDKTKAIMLVHNFGIPAEMDEIMAIAKEFNLRVIEDAAPALGSVYKGKKCGTFGDAACFSFQGAKIAVTGEGGIFVTDDEKLYERAKLYASMGRTDRLGPFWCDELGFQYTISNLSAALALAQVERIEELKAHKREIYSWYEKRLSNVDKIQMVKEKPYMNANYCYPSLFLAKDTKTSRNDILKAFEKENIHGRPGFPQMSRFPMYEQRFENPVAKRMDLYGLVLPSAADLTEKDADHVCDMLLSLI